MPSWGGILKELGDAQRAGNPLPFDYVRRKYLARAFQHTRRATILYASKWTVPDPEIPAELIVVSEQDMTGLMEVLHGVKEEELDLIIHSPGGSVAAAEAFVKYLRSKFRHIRAIIPHAAMSAASMIACACDEIVMGKHSFMGPTDPQFALPTALGTRMVPADAIINQFRLAQEECKDPKRLTAWLPMLQQYGPDLLVQCENAIKLSRELVQQWLAAYRFRGDPDAEAKSVAIAEWLATHGNFNSHSRHLSRDELSARGLAIAPLEADQTLQDEMLSVFHAATHAFAATGLVKIIENHNGAAFMNHMQKVIKVDQVRPQDPHPEPPRYMPPGGGARMQPPFKKKRR